MSTSLSRAARINKLAVSIRLLRGQRRGLGGPWINSPKPAEPQPAAAA
jgi:hypothetical protein